MTLRRPSRKYTWSRSSTPPEREPTHNAPAFSRSRNGERESGGARDHPFPQTSTPAHLHGSLSYDFWRQNETARSPSATSHGSDLAQFKVATVPYPLSGARLGAATERRAPVASSPARPIPVPHSNRPGPSRGVAWR